MQYDIKNRRTFLKRTDYPSVTTEHLYIGSIVTIFSRNLTVVDYADDFTRNRLAQTTEKTIVWAKIGDVGPTMAAIYGNGMKVNQMKTVVLADAQAQELSKPSYAGVKAVVIEVVGSDAVARWTDIAEKGGLSAGSANAAEASTDANAIFGSAFPCFAACESCSLAVILPHAIVEGKAGAIIEEIGQAAQINCVQMFTLGSANAAEFYEVYKGVVPEYAKKVVELTAGPCIAIEVIGDNVVPVLRDVAGPHDPDIGRVIRPNTLRARYGTDKVQNACHVTDLPEDGQLEVEYFFNLLARNV
eukprot:SAG31_NODE_2347_length_5900_cov_11.937425_2_plen_301_part_00